VFRSLCRSLLLAGAACALPALASAHPPGARYRQSPAVLALYGDVPVALAQQLTRAGELLPPPYEPPRRWPTLGPYRWLEHDAELLSHPDACAALTS